MSGLIEQLKEFDIADDTVVDFTWSSGCDIMHYNDDWQDDAMNNTGVIHALAEAVSQGVFFEHGNSVIDELRDDDHLENFEMQILQSTLQKPLWKTFGIMTLSSVT